MIASGILQYSADSNVAPMPQTALIIDDSYPILTYTEPEHNDINSREYFSFQIILNFR